MASKKIAKNILNGNIKGEAVYSTPTFDVFLKT